VVRGEAAKSATAIVENVQIFLLRRLHGYVEPHSSFYPRHRLDRYRPEHVFVFREAGVGALMTVSPVHHRGFDRKSDCVIPGFL
jgi:hypothetical protein